MKKGVIIGLMVAASGCATGQQEFRGQCYHAALAACAIMESYGYENRIAIQKTGKSDHGIYHAQCEAFDPAAKQWRWVVLDSYPTAAWGKREHGETVEIWTKEKALAVMHNRKLRSRQGETEIFSD